MCRQVEYKDVLNSLAAVWVLLVNYIHSSHGWPGERSQGQPTASSEGQRYNEVGEENVLNILSLLKLSDGRVH